MRDRCIQVFQCHMNRLATFPVVEAVFKCVEFFGVESPFYKRLEWALRLRGDKRLSATNFFGARNGHSTLVEKLL